MRRAFLPATCLVLGVVLGGACTTFGEETPGGDAGSTGDSATTDTGTVNDDGGGVVPGDGDGGGGPPEPSCAGGRTIDENGFEAIGFPPTGWSENDSQNLVGLDKDVRSAGLQAMRAGPVGPNVRAMISNVMTYLPATGGTLCLSLDLAMIFTAKLGYVEALQVDMFPTATGGVGNAYIGVGVDKDGVFVHFIPLASASPDKNYRVALSSSEAFHHWTFTANAEGMAAWLDGKQVAKEAFAVPAFGKIDISLGLVGGDNASVPEATSYIDEFRATVLP